MNLSKSKIPLIILTAAFIAFLLLAGFFYFRSKLFESDNGLVAEINNHKFTIEIADEPREQSKGLGNREKLCDDCGMLFLFDKPGRYAFWMKDMKFPLDIIWIAEDKIINLAKNIPADFKGTINPQEDADKVLEINGGLSDKYGIKEGDSVIFK